MTSEVKGPLRAAIFRRDAEAIVSLLRESEPGDHLQLAGDSVLIALDRGVSEAAELARTLVAPLRERGWEGDEELADQLAARLATGPAPELRPLPVDLEELSDVLEGDPRNGGGSIDPRSGQVWPQFVLDAELEEDHDDDEDLDWIPVECEGSRDGYRDMEDFVDALPDPEQRDRLRIALDGRGAFRRFRDVLARTPDDHSRWSSFSDERRRGRARAWLARKGYCVALVRAAPDGADPA